MINLTIDDMTCGGCVASITRVVKNLDQNALVAADVATKHVAITSGADAAALMAAISAAGYHPVAA